MIAETMQMYDDRPSSFSITKQKGPSVFLSSKLVLRRFLLRCVDL
jgi:hypothetical protein